MLTNCMTKCLYQPNHIIPIAFLAFDFSLEIPSQSAKTINIPTAHHEFGANFNDPTLSDLTSY